MNNTTVQTEVFFTTDKHNRPRAYRWSRMQMRSFPIGYDEAKVLIATGQGVDIGGHPFKPSTALTSGAEELVQQALAAAKSVIRTHAYRSGPIGHDGQPRCADCLAISDHPAHVAFAKAGPFASEATKAYARRVVDLEDEGMTTSDAQAVADAELMQAETWTTITVESETPLGTRYQGVSYVGEGRPTFGKLPRNAQVRYTTRLHRSHIEASEQARGRTIHHNLWHDGSGFTAHHSARDCHEVN